MQSKFAWIVTVFIGLTMSGNAISETKEECIRRLQNTLLTCYAACTSSDEVGDCRKTCRQRYAKQPSECAAK